MKKKDTSKAPAKKAAAKAKSKKVYDAVHNAKVLKIHTKKIKARGGEIISSEKTPLGTMIKYKF